MGTLNGDMLLMVPQQTYGGEESTHSDEGVNYRRTRVDELVMMSATGENDGTCAGDINGYRIATTGDDGAHAGDDAVSGYRIRCRYVRRVL